MSWHRATVGLAAVVVAACGGRSNLLLEESASDGAPGDRDGAGDEASAPDASALDARSSDAPLHDGSPSDAGQPAPDTGPATSCNPSTCLGGCCSADGTCVTSNALNACGIEGEACEVCPAGDFCRGSCYHWQADCNPTNCAGCCEGAVLCSTGVSDNACGRGGAGCQRCIPSEGTGQCAPQQGGGGLCNGVVSCNANNCGGCCEGNVCLAGDTQSLCGNGGEACHACGSEQCVLGPPGGSGGGQCLNAGSCGPGSCQGCCEGVGCAYGNQDTACGTGGAACEDCTSQGQKCIAHGCG